MLYVKHFGEISIILIKLIITLYRTDELVISVKSDAHQRLVKIGRFKRKHDYKVTRI